MARLILPTLVVLLAGPAPAQMLSPGPLARPHRQLEGDDNCTQCHERGRGTPDRRCLDCHKAIARRVKGSHGYHARVAQSKRCSRCHRDHLGRAARLVRWPGGDPEHFLHDRTGFVLRDAHAKLKCRQCHTGERIVDADVRGHSGTWLGLASACRQCHRKEDPHEVQFGARQCSECHDERAWKPSKGFDHRRTDFPLTGGHARVICAKCHVKGRFVNTPKSCEECHRQPHPKATRFENR